MVLSCGNVHALPQDWPCKIFELDRYGKNVGESINYQGKDNEYVLDVNVFWHTNTVVDDCGTAGCLGTIKNVKTNKEEHLRFFCEAENNYNKANCSIRKGEEYVLQKITENYYQVNLCGNSYFKYVNLNECFGCTCILHDSRKQKEVSDSYMGCVKNIDSLHCMTGNVYFEKYNSDGKFNDLKSCVGLTSF